MGVDELKKIQEQEDDQMLQPIDLSRRFTQNGNEEYKIGTEEMDYSEENNPYEDMTATQDSYPAISNADEMLTDEHEVPNENVDEMATDETEMYSGNQDKMETDEYQMPN